MAVEVREVERDYVAEEAGELAGNVGDVDPDAVTDRARDLLAERGFEFFNTDHDMTAGNLHTFAEMGAKAAETGKNVYYRLDEYDCWACVAASEEEIAQVVDAAFSDAFAALSDDE